MNPIRRSIRAFLIIAASYVILTLLYVLPIDSIFLLHRTASVFYFIPATFILVYFATRIIDTRVRKNLVIVGILIIFWCVLRAGKYIAFEENEAAARFIWYLYYVPMLAIPQFSFQAALSVGEIEKKKNSPISIAMGIVSVIFMVIILTNDLHEMVFKFNPGYVNWDFDYKRTTIFWIITVWAYLYFLWSTIVLLRKCRLSLSKRLTWIPVVYLVIGILGLLLLNTGYLPMLWGETIGEFPDMVCFALGGFWVLCITIGLVPSNIGYEKLFEQTSIAARITDADYEVVYGSQSAAPLSKEQLAQNGPIAIDDNTLVYRKPVSGGYAYWQTDIAELNEIASKLKEAKESMTEETEFIRLSNELQEKRAQIDAKSNVYDRISVRVLPQSQKIARLAMEAKENPDLFEHNMRFASIYAAYIKRISNMMLLASDSGIQKNELGLAIAESLRYLNKAGILAKIDGELDEKPVEANQLIDIYEHYENVIEQALPEVEALHVILSENVVKLTIEGAEIRIPDDWDDASEIDDGITFVRLYIRNGGDAS